VLRYWETEFPGLRPDKGSTGRRVYARKDVALAAEIRHLLYDKRYTIAGAKRALARRSQSTDPEVIQHILEELESLVRLVDA
jgi:DNA-binding transcriptional MerR regulator